MSDGVEFRECFCLERQGETTRAIRALYSAERYATEEEVRAVVGEEDARGEWVTWEKQGATKVFYYAGFAQAEAGRLPRQADFFAAVPT